MPTLHLNQTNLYYETNGEGQPLVLIHGLGSSGRDWEFQVAEFSKRYRVITPDLRGHGRSDKSAGPYSMKMFAADTVMLFDALGVESAHVVGLSLGGGVAFQLAVDYPARVKSLVIVNSAPELILRTLVEKIAVYQRFVIVPLLGMRRMGQALAPRLFPKPQHAALRTQFVERLAQNDPRAYLDTVRAMVGWSVTERLPTIQCPTLVISADQDYTPVSLKEAYVKAIPNAQLAVIPDAHHATPMEVPDKFNALVMEFIAKQ